MADLENFEDGEKAIDATLIDFEIKITEKKISLTITKSKSTLIIDEILLYGVECNYNQCTSGYYKTTSVFKGPFELGQNKLELKL